jgi:hypothetical protein
VATTVIETDNTASANIIEEISQIENVISVRVLKML